MVNASDLTYTWTIQNFIAYPTLDNYQNVVFSVNWQLTATFVDTSKTPEVTYSALSLNNTPISTDDITNFVPYEQLTLDITIGWISESVNVDAIKLSLLEAIEKQVNPPPPSIVVLPPPF